MRTPRNSRLATKTEQSHCRLVVAWGILFLTLCCPSITFETEQPYSSAMRVGFSFSSGGLLLPYHLGVLDCLQYNGFVTEQTPLAGASAGAIAVATKVCDINSKIILDDTYDMLETCRESFGGTARGNLLPLLRNKLEHRVTEDKFQSMLYREGDAVVTYFELFPQFGPIHRTEFDNKEEFIDAVCHSSTFPFFTSNYPAAIAYNKGKSSEAPMTIGGKEVSIQIPRLYMDGFFAVPGNRFGCPDFNLAGVDNVNRTILVTPFPREAILLDKSIPDEDVICPLFIDNGITQSAALIRLATQVSSDKELSRLYDSGYVDAESWCHRELCDDAHLKKKQ